ncbi:hypothetical protein PHISCL_09136 [Aspergillus sclerotialis]|uniref:Uncharacterized protein n=1 Tax=Aspergillus sclerotialis TaxID=2070753 RepID=A0A3A2Z603_9EURO|nr:hypothetical protein PHISCL_09136 [Aspergillus sclerotialis]
MATAALKKLDQFTIEKTGTKMRFLYEGLIEDCLSGPRDQYEQAKAKTEQELKTGPPQRPAPTPQSAEKRVEQRRQKEKTRPSHSSIY